MSSESFLNYSVDSDVINYYLRLLADKNIKAEKYNADLSEKLQLSENSFLELHQNFLVMQQKLELYQQSELIECSPFSWSGDIEQDQYGDYVDLVLEGVSSRFRWIQPGSFLMGSPTSEFGRDEDETQHSVTLTQGFWMADTACTQDLWVAVMGDNPADFSDDLENPVENVSWDDVQVFLQRINDFVPEMVTRLPSEAEWEYACRAGTRSAFSFGMNITPNQVNYDCNVWQTVPVKALPANPWGLYQMHGNVQEWCQDWYGDYPTGSAIDPSGVTEGTYRVLRGGSWDNDARYVRSANRLYNSPDYRYYIIGFRLVLGQVS